MKKRRINVLGKLLFIAMVFGMFTPLIARAEQDTDARIKKLEAAVRALQEELSALKAERAEEVEKAPPVVDQKKIGEMVEKVLAERPRPELGPTDFRVFWKEGLRFETPDKNFTLKLGGRIMNDWGWMKQDRDVKSHITDPTTTPVTTIGDLLDGTEFRRARLYISGLIYGNVDYKLQFDFAGGDADLKDAYIGLRDFPIGYLKMGHFKEPFGLEELTSSKYITFLERALPMAFAPSRNTGFMLSSTAFDKRMTWAAGVFRDVDSYGEGTSEGGYNVTGRVTSLPWYEENGAKLLHLGAAYSFRNPEDTVRYRQRPEAHLAPYFVDTTALMANRAGLLGLECALVDGPFSVQGEYMRADVDGSSGVSDAAFDGFYLQCSYFLTGEHRNYKTSAGTFDRVKPKKNFSSKKDGGPGAWELATRYSQINLNDVGGGRLKDVTVGLNWYLNPNTRIMWNYIRSDLDDVGKSNLFLMRFQIDF